MVRYPHIATLSYLENEELDGDGNSIGELIKVEIKCRFEPTAQTKNLNYSAKFYTPSKSDFEPFKFDGKTIEFNNKKFKITQLFAFQRHTEIWAE